MAAEKSNRIAVQGGETSSDGAMPSTLTSSKGKRKEVKAMRLPAPPLSTLWPLINTWSPPANHRLVPCRA
jgi:hypothetical protein